MITKTLDTKASSAFLITTACLLLLLSFGYRSGFGLFVKPITEANGRGHEIISIALAIRNLFWGIRWAALAGSGLAAGYTTAAAATTRSGGWVPPWESWLPL
jgi:hypothetical protein